MEFLVKLEIDPPAGTPADAIEDRRTRVRPGVCTSWPSRVTSSASGGRRPTLASGAALGLACQ